MLLLKISFILFGISKTIDKLNSNSNNADVENDICQLIVATIVSFADSAILIN